MLEYVYEGLNALGVYFLKVNKLKVNFSKVYFSKVYLSKVYQCEVYPTCVSSKLCEFIILQRVPERTLRRVRMMQQSAFAEYLDLTGGIGS